MLSGGWSRRHFDNPLTKRQPTGPGRQRMKPFSARTNLGLRRLGRQGDSSLWGRPSSRRAVTDITWLSPESPASAQALSEAKLGRLEAVLFLANEPLSSRKLSQYANLADGTEARTLVARLNQQFDAQRYAFRIEQVAGGYQLATRPQFARWLRRLAPCPRGNSPVPTIPRDAFSGSISTTYHAGRDRSHPRRQLRRGLGQPTGPGSGAHRGTK